MPRPAFLLALAVLATAACGSPPEAGSLGEVDVGRLVHFEELLRTSASCHGVERDAGALTDEGAFAKWWTATTCGETEPPMVDFGRDLVLAARAEQGPTGCYQVRIAEVRTGVGGSLHVIVDRHVPRSSTPCPMVVVHPAHAVKVPAVRRPVVFEWRTVVGPPAEAEAGR